MKTDMPEQCSRCQFFIANGYHSTCSRTGNVVESLFETNDDCPLRTETEIADKAEEKV